MAPSPPGRLSDVDWKATIFPSRDRPALLGAALFPSAGVPLLVRLTSLTPGAARETTAIASATPQANAAVRTVRRRVLARSMNPPFKPPRNQHSPGPRSAP